MDAKVAKLFTNGGSQAVRLPAEFRFDGDEVYIRRDPVTGDVILSSKPGWSTWQEFFAQRDAAGIPADFLTDRPGNEALPVRDLLGEVP
jgi:antitoxin VapB